MNMSNYRILTKNAAKRVVKPGMAHAEAYQAILIDADKRGHSLLSWGGADDCIRSILREMNITDNANEE
jgi:hypothetical protein